MQTSFKYGPSWRWNNLPSLYDRSVGEKAINGHRQEGGERERERGRDAEGGRLKAASLLASNSHWNFASADE